MAPLGISRKERKEEKKETAAPQSAQEKLLDELCGDDRELYEVSIITILLNPGMTVKEGVNSYIEKAEEYKKTKDNVKARIAYQIAGEISLYEGNLSQAQELFKKAAEADPNYLFRKAFEYFSQKKNAERALAVAQEFYTKIGKTHRK